MSDPKDYTVGWICAIEPEFVAAQAFLDEEHDQPITQDAQDSNGYALGKMGAHSVVIAGLPDGEYGTDTAATVAKDMLRSFPNIRIGLMVGIGGGAPSSKHDVRLGDVVVSRPGGGTGGVFNYDFGKVIQNQAFLETRFLNQPPDWIRTKVGLLKSRHALRGHNLEDKVNRVLEKWPSLRKGYTRPTSMDTLYKSTFIHRQAIKNDECEVCGKDPLNLEDRPMRNNDADDLVIHYGLIASANKLIKDAVIRDKLADEREVLCFEMEAAGLMNRFPCLVIRGICDYTDTHKNKKWQGFAAMMAAAYAKDLLALISPSNIEAQARIEEILSSVLDGVSTTKATVTKIKSELDAKKDLEILDWLTPIDYGPKQSDYIRRRQMGTGQWLLDTEIFKSWRDTSNQTLFCPGIPGAGKTIITSIVIDSLVAEFQDRPSTGVAYVYCDFRRKSEQKIGHILSSLLKQLAERSNSIPQAVVDLYNQHKGRRTCPSLDELSTTLHSVAAQYSRVFIIVDALDECPESDGCRNLLISELFEIQKQSAINIFATSRFVPEIVNQFKDCSKWLEIRASYDDVDRYLTAHMDQLRSFVRRNPSLQGEIKTEILTAVDGMFLLAQIYLGLLDDKLTVNEIRSTLQVFRKQRQGQDEDGKAQVLSHAYQQTMERIGSQEQNAKALAFRILAWITCSRRQLSTSELQHAIATKLDKSTLDQGDIPDMDDMVSVCSGLIVIDEQSGGIRLVHYTTQEYFERTRMDWFPNANIDIGETCVAYLSLQPFTQGYCQTESEFEQRLQTNPLYDYAAKNWGHHVREAQALSDRVAIYLKQQKLVETTSQVVLASSLYLPDFLQRWDSKRIPTEVKGVHLAAYFGLTNMLASLLGTQTPNQYDTWQRTPLWYAANNGWDDTVEFLLADERTDPDTKDDDEQTPLMWAVKNGNDNVVKLLLMDNRVNANFQDKMNGNTALHIAMGKDRGNIAKLLIEKGLSTVCQNIDRQSPLSIALERNEPSVLQALFNTGIQVLTSTQSVSPHEDKECVVFLHQKGLCFDSGTNELRMSIILDSSNEGHVIGEFRDTLLPMPFCWEVWTGNLDFAKLLLGKGLNVECEDRNGMTALSGAAVNNYATVAMQLLSKGDSHSGMSSDGATPLFWATRCNNVEVAKVLVDGGANVNQEAEVLSRELYSSRTATPLFWAAKYNSAEVAKILIDGGAVVDDYDRNCRTPLFWALESGNAEVANVIFDAGADVECADVFGQTYLSWAIEENNAAAVRMLIDRGANVNKVDGSGRTPLLLSASGNQREMVLLLLNHGASPSYQNRRGETPLFLSAEHNDTVVIEALILKGARVDHEDEAGETPLFWAVRSNSHDAVQVLLENGATLDHKSRNNHTILRLPTKVDEKEVFAITDENGVVQDLTDSEEELVFC